ncbi:MAG: hypothetical protein HY698_13120 [Deltaproteobacteria bacterium]|nr:hypothetical protein [Deltaproteobacteria bacterium]
MDKVRRPRELYQQAKAAFDLGEYDRAIALFKEAHSISGAPRLLYNIAQSYRLKQDCATALHFYGRYLRAEPDTPNRDKVQSLIAEMEECVQRQAMVAPTQEVAPIVPTGENAETRTTLPTPTSLPPKDSPRNRRGAGMRVAGLATAALGGLAIGSGLYFHWRASVAASDLQVLYEKGGTWSTDFRAKEHAIGRFNTMSVVMHSAGGMAVLAGLTTYFWGMRKGRSLEDVAIVPRAGGTLIECAWAF